VGKETFLKHHRRATCQMTMMMMEDLVVDSLGLPCSSSVLHTILQDRGSHPKVVEESNGVMGAENWYQRDHMAYEGLDEDLLAGS
jgi:hypothetical protein